MSNIVNKSFVSTKDQELFDALIEVSRKLSAAVLDRPTCGCDKPLCSHCRRDKHEVDLANKLSLVLEEFN